MTEAVEASPDELMDIYARKSVAIKGRLGELSPNAQEQRGRDWGGWNHLRVRHIWRDTISASKDVERPDYDKALLALANGEVKTLWCYKLDRFSRRGALAVLSVLENLNSTGARIIFGEDGLDSSNPDHRRMIMWKAEDARDEAERISKRVRDTKDWQRNHGEWVSGRVPYGLKADTDRKLVKDTAPARPDHPRMGSKATVAQRIFKLAQSGTHSLRDIAAALDADKIPSPSGKSWNANTVYRIVTNAAYSGWQVHCVGNQRGIIYRDPKGKRVKVGVVLVPDTEREAAVRVIKGHSKPVKTFTGKATNLLTGLTRCTCGKSAPVSSRSYTCTTALHSGTACPAPASAYRPAVEGYVVNQWLARLTYADPDDPLLRVVAARWAALTKPDETAEVKEAIAVLKSAEDTLERLLRDRRAGLYEGPAARFFEPAYKDAMADYNAASSALREHGGVAVDITFLLNRQSALDAWEDADLEMRRDLLRLAIDRVIIKKWTGGGPFNGDQRVEIMWAATAEESKAA
ncbi:recombinase family protein [Streptomyces sp. NBC_01500]|uniref:recombinase family protein n=1 Tax=Streptomyces sp. NBC_01500 TaxID=2903886 RepID=UPI00224F88BC|nr:recombinase family protein [Streptomyces sp. NBC_01500]MCX4547292.1 recombinase family protein [Streptomyces sp. NBC_01500]MCX4554552.1 recombinase family protein [Streptomyces sp. NBC_01500]